MFIRVGSKTGHSALFLVISSSSELRIAYRFSWWTPCSSSNILSKFQFFFSIGSIGPQSFSSVGVHRSRFEYGALGLVRIISPSSKLRIAYHFFMDSLFFKEYYVKISIFFSTGSTGPQNFNSVGVHRSRFKYGALCLLFSHISFIRTQNCVPFYFLFFMDSLFFKEYSFKISIFFSIRSTSLLGQLVQGTDFGDFGA